MELSEMKKNFLEIPQYSAYKPELDNFEAYLVYKGQLNQVYLQGIRTTDIIDSIRYIVKNRQYSTKSIALKYMTVIAQLFRYATMHNWFNNDNFLLEVNAPDEDIEHSYYRRVSDYIYSNTLLDSPSRKETISQDEAAKIIDYTNTYISEKNREVFSVDKCSALLALKLALFTGVKYKALCSLKISDVKLDTNQININGFHVRMPIQFTDQMRLYLNSRSKYACDFLFIQSNGSPWNPKSTQSSKITEILKYLLCRIDTTGVTKYGIRQLLSVGTSIPIIEDLTGAKKDVIRGCGSESMLSESEQRSNYLNRQISQTDIYFLC